MKVTALYTGISFCVNVKKITPRTAISETSAPHIPLQFYWQLFLSFVQYHYFSTWHPLNIGLPFNKWLTELSRVYVCVRVCAREQYLHFVNVWKKTHKFYLTTRYNITWPARGPSTNALYMIKRIRVYFSLIKGKVPCSKHFPIKM